MALVHWGKCLVHSCRAASTALAKKFLLGQCRTASSAVSASILAGDKPAALPAADQNPLASVFTVFVGTLWKGCCVLKPSAGVRVEWESGGGAVFHPVWLRHNCHCEQCREGSNGQRIVPVNKIEADLPPTRAGVQDGQLWIEWKSGHRSVFDTNFLQQHAPSAAATNTAKSRLLRPPAAPSHIPTLDFRPIIEDDAGLLQWLEHLTMAGMCIVRNAGVDAGVVVALAERVSGVQPTIYGRTFDVISTPNPINVAYSPVPLELHIDLAYYESPPGLQLLHCVRFDEHVQGGESTLADMFATAEDLRAHHPQAFETLSTVPASFQKIHYRREVPVHITFERPIIQTNRHGEVVTVTWAPPFEAPLQNVTLEETDRYYKAYLLFSQLLEKRMVRFRLKPGDVLTFNNRRIAHGREGFVLPPDGQRHLVGTYIHIDEFRSRHRILRRQHGQDVNSPRVFNSDMQ